MMRKGVAILTLIALSQAAVVRAAPPPDDATRAAALFRESVKAYRDGRFQDAVDLLERARQLKSEPVLLYDLGRAYEALGKSTEAASAYGRYLEEDPNAADRKAVEGRIATLRRQAEDREALRRAEAARAAQPPPPAPAPAPSVVTPPPPPPPPASDPLAPVPWIVGGVGVAAIGVGAVFGLVARGRYDSAQADPSQASAASKYDDAKKDAVIANVGFVAGAVLVVAAGVWLVVRANAPKPAAAAGAPAFAALLSASQGVTVRF